MYSFSFERLDVWQNSRQFAKILYDITNNFPATEKYSLVPQLRRATISVISNIAEGSSRKTTKDQSHFYNTAFSSLMEVLSQIIISRDLSFIDQSEYLLLRTDIEKISNQLNALRNSITKT